MSLIMTALLGAALLLGGVMAAAFVLYAACGLLFRTGGWFSLIAYTAIAFLSTLVLGLGSFILWLRL